MQELRSSYWCQFFIKSPRRVNQHVRINNRECSNLEHSLNFYKVSDLLCRTVESSRERLSIYLQILFSSSPTLDSQIPDSVSDD